MDPGLLMTVLAQGEQQTRQLKAQLDDPLEVESCKSLARQVQLSFENAIAMVKSLGTGVTGTGNVAGFGGWDSPPQSGGSESPRSEGSDQGTKGEMMMCKKRKGLPKWSSQVRVNLGGGIEGPLDDGYSWRKYGQKDILGAKFPRGYYRCTHRNSQGCLATKQVQRSDDDPSVFDVSYRGAHTCVEKPQKAQASPKRIQYNPSDSNHHHHQQQLLDSLRASLTVKTEGLEANGGQANTANSSSFSFPSTPASCMQPQSNMFLSPSVHDNNPFSSSTFSPNFMSGTASETNYFSSYGAAPNVHNSASELINIVSAATSAANSPTLDIDFALGHGEFDPNFAFDSSSFFCIGADKYCVSSDLGSKFPNVGHRFRARAAGV